jgi:hypothetical protein
MTEIKWPAVRGPFLWVGFLGRGFGSKVSLGLRFSLGQGTASVETRNSAAKKMNTIFFAADLLMGKFGYPGAIANANSYCGENAPESQPGLGQ